MKSDIVYVEKVNTADREGKGMELILARWQGKILSVDAYTLIPSVRIDQAYFQVEVA